jgi:predicted DCC family thiol-disulfide oxidoreductase YuxK
MDASPRLKIFTDGKCPTCRAARARVEPWDRNHRLEFLDYNEPVIAAQAPFSRDELADEMHVLIPDGSWRVGFDGWAAILKELPAWRWLGAMGMIPPVRWIGRPFYRFFARHRYRISGLASSCPDGSCSTAGHPKSRPLL